MFLSNFFKFKKLSNDKKIWLVSNESKVLKRNLQKLCKNKIQIALPSNFFSRILLIFSKQRDIILYRCILIHATILSQIEQSIYRHSNFATTHTCTRFQNRCQIPENCYHRWNGVSAKLVRNVTTYKILIHFYSFSNLQS